MTRHISYLYDIFPCCSETERINYMVDQYNKEEKSKGVTYETTNSLDGIQTGSEPSALAGKAD